MPGVKAKPIEERFWAAVVKTESPILEGHGPCWLYGAKPRNKYAAISRGVGLGVTAAHRFSFELHGSEIPRGKFVCHRCDIKNCVNPSHLYVGDHEDNNQDNRERGLFKAPKVRTARVKTRPGEGSHGRKLGVEYIERLKAEYASGEFTQMELAKRYGVSQGTISATVRGAKNMGDGKGGGKRAGNFKRKLSPESLAEIKSLYAAGGHTQSELAERFGCDQTYVSLIVRGMN